MNLSIDTQLVSDSSILNKPVMQFHLLLSDEAFECWTNLTGSLNSWKMTKPIKHWMQEEFNAVQENHHILHCKQKQVISMQLLMLFLENPSDIYLEWSFPARPNHKVMMWWGYTVEHDPLLLH